MSNEFWLLTVPNEGRTPEQTFERLRRYTDEFSKGYLVQIPSLTVGTLDSLMALSDDMEKVDNSIEVAVRKIERQYAEICGGSGRTREPLLIDAVPVERYLPSFVWEHAKYPHRRALPELVGSLRSCVGAIEDELKHLTITYAEKTQKLASLNRGAAATKGAKASLALSPLEDVLRPEHLEGVEFLDTEYLVTVVVAVPKPKEAQFLETYASIASDVVISDGAACSPAVPGSAKKLTGDDTPRKLDEKVRAQVLECASDIMPEMDTKALLKASADKLRAAAKDAGKDSEKEAEEVIQKVETHEEAAPNAKPSPPKQA